ncbi:11825_t:CDS:2 [Entrophospora sp. SA101]|nr:11825_t:CDS:2 [Entrophospora sp. SA101]
MAHVLAYACFTQAPLNAVSLIFGLLPPSFQFILDATKASSAKAACEVALSNANRAMQS